MTSSFYNVGITWLLAEQTNNKHMILWPTFRDFHIRTSTCLFFNMNHFHFETTEIKNTYYLLDGMAPIWWPTDPVPDSLAATGDSVTHFFPMSFQQKASEKAIQKPVDRKLKILPTHNAFYLKFRSNFLKWSSLLKNMGTSTKCSRMTVRRNNVAWWIMQKATLFQNSRLLALCFMGENKSS